MWVWMQENIMKLYVGKMFSKINQNVLRQPSLKITIKSRVQYFSLHVILLFSKRKYYYVNNLKKQTDKKPTLPPLQKD